jgi:hypothetical protein
MRPMSVHRSKKMKTCFHKVYLKIKIRKTRKMAKNKQNRQPIKTKIYSRFNKSQGAKTFLPTYKKVNHQLKASKKLYLRLNNLMPCYKLKMTIQHYLQCQKVKIQNLIFLKANKSKAKFKIKRFLTLI